MKKTLLLGPFCAPNTNAINSELVIGIPSPLAGLGFARKLSILTGQDSSTTERACAIFHNFQISSGRHKPAPVNKNKSDYSNIETPEKITGHTTFSILLHYPENFVGNENVVWEKIKQMRYAGSALFPADVAGNSMPWHTAKRDKYVRFLTEENLQDSLLKIPQGWMYLPITETTKSVFKPTVFGEGKENIHHLIHTMDRARKDENHKAVLQPTLCAFQAYQECRQAKSDTSFPRAIVSPMFSVCEQLSSRSLFFTRPEFSVDDMWHYAFSSQKETTYLSPSYKGLSSTPPKAQTQGDFS